MSLSPPSPIRACAPAGDSFVQQPDAGLFEHAGATDVAYNCVVCVKQVPDTKRITGQAMKEDGTVNRAALPAIFNFEDMNALEEALAIRDTHGGAVSDFHQTAHRNQRSAATAKRHTDRGQPVCRPRMG